MPDLLNERQGLPIESMFHANDHCRVLQAADFSQIESIFAGHLHQIAYPQTHSGWSWRETDAQQLPIETMEKSLVPLTVGQTANRNLLILPIRHNLHQCSIGPNLWRTHSRGALTRAAFTLM
jgi:hypothetical protein